MGAYILRRILLTIPTLLGIMLINFALTQFVPGGPVEQVLARLEGQGDAFKSVAGGAGDAGAEQAGAQDSGGYIGARGLPPEFIDQLEAEFGFALCHAARTYCPSKGSFSGWDFTGVWKLEVGQAAPILRTDP